MPVARAADARMPRMPRRVWPLEAPQTWLADRAVVVKTNGRYHFGVGAPPKIVYFSGDWDVH